MALFLSSYTLNMASSSLIALIRYALTYEAKGDTDEQEMDDWERHWTWAKKAIPAAIKREGLTLLGMGNQGVVLNNNDGTCTKYCVLPGPVDEGDNEISNSYFAGDIQVGPMVHEHELMEIDGFNWFGVYTMDVVQGIPLEQYILDGNDYSWVGARLAELVAYMHGQDLVHKDLHQNNIIVTPDDDLMFIDWGLSSSKGGSHMEKVDDYVRSMIISTPI